MEINVSISKTVEKMFQMFAKGLPLSCHNTHNIAIATLLSCNSLFIALSGVIWGFS